MQEEAYRAIPLRGKGDTVRAYALVDAGDYATLNQRRWHLMAVGYAASNISKVPRRTIMMHRLILGLERGDGLQVDHINRDKLDNRRANLRVVTKAQNSQNQGVRADNTSGYRGVSFDRRPKSRSRPWVAECWVSGRKHHIGMFPDRETAAAAASEYRAAHMPFSEDAL